MISDHRLRDWLRLLNYRVHYSSFYNFVPPVYGLAQRDAAGDSAVGVVAGTVEGGRPADGSWLARFAPWPVVAACYIVVARKEGFVVTPIRPALKRRAQLVGSLVNPTTRNAA